MCKCGHGQHRHYKSQFRRVNVELDYIGWCLDEDCDCMAYREQDSIDIPKILPPVTEVTTPPVVETSSNTTPPWVSSNNHEYYNEDCFGCGHTRRIHNANGGCGVHDCTCTEWKDDPPEEVIVDYGVVKRSNIKLFPPGSKAHRQNSPQGRMIYQGYDY